MFEYLTVLRDETNGVELSHAVFFTANFPALDNTTTHVAGICHDGAPQVCSPIREIVETEHAYVCTTRSYNKYIVEKASLLAKPHMRVSSLLARWRHPDDALTFLDINGIKQAPLLKGETDD